MQCHLEQSLYHSYDQTGTFSKCILHFPAPRSLSLACLPRTSEGWGDAAHEASSSLDATYPRLPQLQPIFIQSFPELGRAAQLSECPLAQGFSDGRVVWVREDLIQSCERLQVASLHEDMLRHPVFVPVGFTPPELTCAAIAATPPPRATSPLPDECVECLFRDWWSHKSALVQRTLLAATVTLLFAFASTAQGMYSMLALVSLPSVLVMACSNACRPGRTLSWAWSPLTFAALVPFVVEVNSFATPVNPETVFAMLTAVLLPVRFVAASVASCRCIQLNRDAWNIRLINYVMADNVLNAAAYAFALHGEGYSSALSLIVYVSSLLAWALGICVVDGFVAPRAFEAFWASRAHERSSTSLPHSNTRDYSNTRDCLCKCTMRHLSHSISRSTACPQCCYHVASTSSSHS
ncbi:hypothetical protein AB1Y20_009546 [Prymnesium parvum]|uniref:Uncharacterized protein n=1 Tax=Prymnesium parvum TaxID=97485 RepID=A0AB34K485_PRYPA